MNCDEARPLLELDADGELDVVRHVALTEHVRNCPACAVRTRALEARRHALQSGLPRHRATAELAAKVQSALRTEAAAATSQRFPSNHGERQGSAALVYLQRATGMAALIAVSWVIGYTFGNRHGQSHRWLDEAVDSHVRSLEAGPLLDVASTDQHTVKPWFAGKLAFSPPVFDLANEGFPLIGGRREYLFGQSVAALVFHRHQHTINLYIWPNHVSPRATQEAELNGYHTEMWSANGFNFLAVSDVGAVDLALFAKAYRLDR